jgi:SAM-dependent methyltransferase
VIGRWARARALLRPEERAVLDAGCAFGFGTARLGRARRAVGLEYDAAYVARARRDHPDLPWVQGDVQRLPFRSGRFDAVLLLEVIEHISCAAVAIAEARRVLRPGGALIVSVPHRGTLAGLDSLNRYTLWAARRGWPPLESTEAGAPEHRHFSRAELESLLSGFRVERVIRTGTGLPELLNLGLLVGARGLARSEPLYGRLRWLYYTLAIADDALPLGSLGYQIMIRAVRIPGDGLDQEPAGS